ncbi:hypothetical protein LMG27952_05090 [Paraburkholderia hiiakae]|uniref:Uncharacterized protein n=1 Tax=Paraburkholderia hiiakae TaxID=1081782 RepID=A0ABM8NZN5_9BURK|nr:hypothetical protein [Paraburkholderia hiiakae]CAD6550908.1 hypothetical protein LMG27952_05090 [Paraburkholderia hiiakae]
MGDAGRAFEYHEANEAFFLTSATTLMAGACYSKLGSQKWDRSGFRCPSDPRLAAFLRYRCAQLGRLRFLSQGYRARALKIGRPGSGGASVCYDDALHF